MDSHLGVGRGSPGPFSLIRETTAIVLVGAALATLAVIKARSPDAEPSAALSVAAIAGTLTFYAVPLQALAIVYAAGILAATSRRSPVTTASLAAGTVTGLATGLATSLAVYEIARTSDRYVGILFLGVVTTLFLFAALAGLTAAWLLPGAGDPENVRVARGLQGLLAGSVAGGVCGLLLANFYVIAVVMMIIGPVVGALGGAVGGFVAAGHPLRPRPARSWAAGVFVRF